MNAAPATIAADLLAGFPSALRQAGLPIDPGRAANFLSAAKICRLREIADLARAGRVTLTGSPEDFPVFDAVFDNWFGARIAVAAAPSDDEQEAPENDRPRGDAAMLDLAEGDAAGTAAAQDEVRNRKTFRRLTIEENDALGRLRRGLDNLPAVARRTWVASPSGRRIDMARTARAARRTFGETLRILRQTRPQRPRKLLLLIDVSGSMKAQSEIYLSVAHLLTGSRPGVETFCFGTRLSRVTKTLKPRNRDDALAKLSDLVFDFDGGTLIGASLESFLSASRHAALVRGAIVMVFSDGLERGDPSAMISSVHRLARLSHRLIWVTPLAADPRYRPVTRAMAGILPALDRIADGASLASLERLPALLERMERSPRGEARRQFRMDI